MFLTSSMFVVHVKQRPLRNFNTNILIYKFSFYPKLVWNIFQILCIFSNNICSFTTLEAK